MRVIAIDTETDLICQGNLAPTLVCVSVCDGKEPRLLRWDSAKQAVAEAFTAAAECKAIVTGHNFSFDVGVFLRQWPDLFPLIFAAYDANGVEDTMLREKLYNLSRGELDYREHEGRPKRVLYSLDAITQRWFGTELDKSADGWRLRYMGLRDTPLIDWPRRAIEYAKKDAQVTRDLYMHQSRRDTYPDTLHDSPAQARAALALHLMSCRGMVVDRQRVLDLRRDLRVTVNRYRQELDGAGLVKPDGGIAQKHLRALVKDVLGDKAPTTEKGNIKIDAETLNHHSDGNPIFRPYVAFKKAEKLLTAYVEKLEFGFGGPIQPRCNSLLATGRTSMLGWTGTPDRFKGFSLQTLPRSGGVRECFIPREGFEFVDTDYSTAELRSLAQFMLGIEAKPQSTVPMAKLFQADKYADPHLHLAASIQGISVDEAERLLAAGDKTIKQARQDAKAANFGFPGGMGVDRFIASERKKFIESGGAAGGLYDKKKAQELRAGYMDRWDMQPYFGWVAAQVDDGHGLFQSAVSKRLRSGCGFSDGANNGFQSMTADGAKAALWDLVKAMYLAGGALGGCYLVNFIHDETLIEVPKGYGQAAGDVVASIMVEAMQRYTPDIPAVAEPQVMERWKK